MGDWRETNSETRNPGGALRQPHSHRSLTPFSCFCRAVEPLPTGSQVLRVVGLARLWLRSGLGLSVIRVVGLLIVRRLLVPCVRLLLLELLGLLWLLPRLGRLAGRADGRLAGLLALGAGRGEALLLLLGLLVLGRAVLGPVASIGAERAVAGRLGVGRLGVAVLRVVLCKFRESVSKEYLP